MSKELLLIKIQACCLMSFFIGCNNEPILPYYNTPDFTPIFCKNKTAVKTQITHTIDSFNCTNQFNETINNSTVANKIYIANFFFTSCGSICPKMMNNLKIVNTKFNNDSDVVILSYSVTPWIDSVAKLKKYYNNILPNTKNWHLLTGDKAAIYHLARQSYFAEQDLGFTKDSTAFLHTEHFLLVDKTGRLRGIYNGTLQLESEQLIKDIEMLKQEN